MLRQQLAASSDKTKPEPAEPGDQVLVAIPHRAGETGEVWGYCLDRKHEPGEIWVVIDEIVVINHRPGFAPNSVIKVPREWVLRRIPRDPEAPVLHFTLQEGALVEMRRVDGKMAPTHIRIDEGDGATFYRVDHTGFEPVDPPG